MMMTHYWCSGVLRYLHPSPGQGASYYYQHYCYYYAWSYWSINSFNSYLLLIGMFNICIQYILFISYLCKAMPKSLKKILFTCMQFATYWVLLLLLICYVSSSHMHVRLCTSATVLRTHVSQQLFPCATAFFIQLDLFTGRFNCEWLTAPGTRLEWRWFWQLVPVPEVFQSDRSQWPAQERVSMELAPGLSIPAARR